MLARMGEGVSNRPRPSASLIWLAFLLLGALAAGTILLGPAAAGAATSSVVDFETGPPLGQPIENDYASSASVFWRPEDPGFRPYRRETGVPTHSGTVAAE